ncbi:lipid A biosynthesis (KDO)2-(lauroyl)-lipid IVA acyltransferase [Salmonella enterica subsp. arizonae]|uniref:Lipid A biosynthesis (KDO)2-(Lauroyl)-lipid IVA acyltransferase n=1 Tax=Salmonella enterica subsp. arizonae TaxID=59203 RepID=A0A379S349_SALER|nr:lipid A biosynthesis (KDO)2-(lauroyl)-lipid IVA acyltransferase [Salmonella enterica subsp. arizonae]
METKKNNSEYIPEFEKSFHYPQYWGAWLGAAAMAGMALTRHLFATLCSRRWGVLPDGWERVLVVGR